MERLVWLFLLVMVRVSAQITGTVVSDTGKPLARANLILYNAQNNIETYAFSKDDGSFVLTDDKAGTFRLEIRYPNYHTVKMEVVVHQVKEKRVLGKIPVSAIPENEIKEVVITRKDPIRIRKDTIEYDVAKFADKTEHNVEDLLKKLPGITVDLDGKIKFGKTEISSVMVEGDDLFERGYQTLTKNMPADPIKSVEVLKHYSKNKLLKGIQQSDAVALNLKLKDKAKDQWFGSADLASTSYKEDMREIRFNLMNFSKKKKVYLLYNANNLGDNEMNGVQYLMKPEISSDAENVGSDLDGQPVINLHRKNMRFDEKRTNFNNDQLASLNYIYNFEKAWKLKFVTIYNPVENRSYQNSFYHFNFNGVDFTNTENNTWKQDLRNIVGKLELNKEFKKNANLNIYNKLSTQQEDNHNEMIFNDQLNPQTGRNRLFSDENRLTYTQKIDSSQAFVAIARYVFQDRPYNFTDQNNAFQAILNNPAIDWINQQVHSKMQFAGAKASWLKTWNEDQNLEVQAGNEYRKDFLSSNLSLFDAQQQPVSFDASDYTNLVDYALNTGFIRAKYHLKTKKWTYDFTLLNQLVSSDLNQKKQTGVYLTPTFSIGYQIKRNNSLSLNASRQYRSTTINDVYTNLIYQGSRSLGQNDVGYVQMPSYNFGLSYNLGNELDQAIKLSANYTHTNDYLASNLISQPDYSISQKILVKDQNMAFGNLELRKFVNWISSRISLIGSYMRMDYQNSVNDQPLIKTTTSNTKAGFEMKSGWIKGVNYEAGYSWTFNNIQSDVNSRQYIDQKGYFNFYVSFAKLWNVKSMLEYYKFGGAHQQSTQFWDVSLNYRVPSVNMQFYMDAMNLLNSDQITQYSIDNVSESLYTQRLLPRHIVFGVSVSF